MFDSDIQARAREIIDRRRSSSSAAIDRAALRSSVNRPVIVCKFVSNTLGGLMGLISGADYAGNKTNSYYQQALKMLLDSTGSPAAQQFAGEQKAALQPEFDQQDKALAAKEAAMGITNSGASKADFSDLTGQQSRTLAGVTAPLYQTAMADYGGMVGAMPGAEMGAYQHALDNFYSAVESAATGMPSMRQSAAMPASSPSYGVVPGASATPGAVSVSGDPYNMSAPDYNPYSSTA